MYNHNVYNTHYYYNKLIIKTLNIFNEKTNKKRGSVIKFIWKLIILWLFKMYKSF